MNAMKPKESNYMIIYSYDKNMNNSEEVEQIKEFAAETPSLSDTL